jgi:hypothetical protein
VGQQRADDFSGNNDPTITFADIQKVLRLIEERIASRLTKESQGNKK